MLKLPWFPILGLLTLALTLGDVFKLTCPPKLPPKFTFGFPIFIFKLPWVPTFGVLTLALILGEVFKLTCPPKFPPKFTFGFPIFIFKLPRVPTFGVLTLVFKLTFGFPKFKLRFGFPKFAVFPLLNLGASGISTFKLIFAPEFPLPNFGDWTPPKFILTAALLFPWLLFPRFIFTFPDGLYCGFWILISTLGAVTLGFVLIPKPNPAFVFTLKFGLLLLVWTLKLVLGIFCPCVRSGETLTKFSIDLFLVFKLTSTFNSGLLTFCWVIDFEYTIGFF